MRGKRDRGKLDDFTGRLLAQHEKWGRLSPRQIAAFMKRVDKRPKVTLPLVPTGRFAVSCDECPAPQGVARRPEREVRRQPGRCRMTDVIVVTLCLALLIAWVMDKHLEGRSVETQIAADTCEEHAVFCCPWCFGAKEDDAPGSDTY